MNKQPALNLSCIVLLATVSACGPTSHRSDSSVSAQASCFLPSSGLEIINGLPGFSDYDEGLQCAMKAGRPLFIYFTCYGCLPTRGMETQMFLDPSVRQKIKENFVVVYLRVDDRSRIDERRLLDSASLQPRTIGERWTKLQSQLFDNRTQPFCGFVDIPSMDPVGGIAFTPDAKIMMGELDKIIEKIEQRAR